MNIKHKALVVATVGRFLNFEKNDIDILKALGYEVHCAANFMAEDIDQVPHINECRHQIDFARSPFSISTIRAYLQLKQLLSEEKYDLIHCHTPVGGILTRLVVRKYRKQGCKVFYTAHGFHFFKGAPLLNWLIFYPAEWICAWCTDVLITINLEDYARAKKHFHAKKIEYIPGVGIDLNKFKVGTIDITEKRRSIKVESNEKILLSVGELSERKNHKLIIQALSKLGDSKVKYFICGQGALKEDLEKLICSYKLEKQVFLLGYRNDISELCQCADLFVFPSLQEGLPVALMEAIACKLPAICSNIRGNVDLIQNKKHQFSARSEDEVVSCIQQIFKEDKEDITAVNYKKLQEFDIKNVEKLMCNLYKDVNNELEHSTV